MSANFGTGADRLERAAIRFARKDLGGAREELDELLTVPGLTGAERGTILHARGVAFMELGQLGPAAADLAASARLLPHNEPQRLGHVLDDAGVVDIYKGNVRRGAKTLARALRCLTAAGDMAGMARAYDHLALANIKAGRFGDAGVLLARSQALWLQLRDADGLADVLDTYGKHRAARREWSSSLAFHSRALELRAESPDRFARAKTLASIGVALRHLGRLREALRIHHDCMFTRACGGDPIGTANSRNGLGLVLLDLGHRKAARKQLRRALQARLAMGDSVNAARVRRNLRRLTREQATVTR